MAVAVSEWRVTVRDIQCLPLIGLGFLWGVASHLYGVTVDLLGIALVISIQLGLSIVAGAVIPRVAADALAIHSLDDLLFFTGIAVMVAGLRMTIAILGGLGAPLLNVGISMRSTWRPPRGRAGCRDRSVTNGWHGRFYLSAAAVSQAGYCFYQMAKSSKVSTLWASKAALIFSIRRRGNRARAISRRRFAESFSFRTLLPALPPAAAKARSASYSHGLSGLFDNPKIKKGSARATVQVDPA